MSDAPVLIEEPNFLTRAQCRAILGELSFAFWYPSAVVEAGAGGCRGRAVRTSRISETTDESWFGGSLPDAISTIDRRLAERFPKFEARREAWQATRYRKGGRFKAHLDCGHWGEEPAGERQCTFLLFLDRPRGGGETCFPRLGRIVPPAAGLLLAWRNLTAAGDCDRMMLHASLPVTEGTKTVLVTWLRERPVGGRAT